MNLLMHKNIPVNIVRTSGTKSATIVVERGHVTVRVPSSVPMSRIEKLVQSRTNWIREKLQVQSQIVLPKPKEMVTGESFSYLGKNYRLKLTQGENSEVKLKNGYLTLQCEKNMTTVQRENFVRHSLQAWYQSRALGKLKEKVSRYEKVLGVKSKSVSVYDFKTRWGSCSVSGDIRFNWRIIMAPNAIVDYVVVHELSHLVHHDHSDKFWRTIASVIFDYADRKQWLKTDGHKLLILKKQRKLG